jgi:hypothetical protein
MKVTVDGVNTTDMVSGNQMVGVSYSVSPTNAALEEIDSKKQEFHAATKELKEARKLGDERAIADAEQRLQEANADLANTLRAVFGIERASRQAEQGESGKADGKSGAALANQAASTGENAAKGTGIEQATSNSNSNRIRGVVYVTGHPVDGSGGESWHAALEFTFPDGKTETLSAGPSSGWFVFGQGSLVSDVNRPTDSPEKNKTIAFVISPGCSLSGEDYWQLLRAVDSKYDDAADYDLYPGWLPWNNGWNSNSYVSGLIQATNGSLSREVDPSQFDGFDVPLPPSWF